MRKTIVCNLPQITQKVYKNSKTNIKYQEQDVNQFIATDSGFGANLKREIDASALEVIGTLCSILVDG